MSYATARSGGALSETNKLHAEDRAIHEWYRFILAFPPHLARDYLERFGADNQTCVLDPFTGTGTVVVECKKRGVPSIGVEANPMAHFASQVKTNWTPDPDALVEHAMRVAQAAWAQLAAEGIEDSPMFEAQIAALSPLRTLAPEATELILTNSISPVPLHKALVLLACIEDVRDERFYSHERLAFAKSVVFSSSNLHFGPEVGVGQPKPDAPVVAPWLECIHAMARDLRSPALQAQRATTASVYLGDARQLRGLLAPNSIDMVITSPPYPNEKDYTRTTRLESVLLGFLTSKADLRALKHGLLRSNTRTVYKGDDDDIWVADQPEIQRIADEIEARRIMLNKTSGFERQYAKVTRQYFGGMARHLAELRPALRPGAQLAYVVGDQASFLRVMIPTGQLLADIARSIGYEVVGIDLWRTRLATATKAQLREEVVVLRWPG